MKKPDIFYAFYRSMMIYPDAQPNKAHSALASLEAKGKLRAVITQNIDGLHQKPEAERFMNFMAAYTGITA